MLRRKEGPILRRYVTRLSLKIILSAICLICLVASAGAQQSPLSRTERQGWALDALKIVAPIYKALPTLSPAENQWVESELKASAGAGSWRVEHLFQSREWAIYTVHFWIDGSYACLVELIGQPHPLKAREALLWAVVVNGLYQDGLYEALDRLVDLGSLDPKLVRSPDAPVGRLQGIYAYLAMDRMVIPFLDHRLPD